jgi:hypothetical protein
MDPDADPDPAIFLIDLQDANKILMCLFKRFFCLLLFEGAFTSFSKISQKAFTKQYESRFSYYFCLVIEGSGPGAGSESGSIPLTNGSGAGSRRPKNMWIRIRNAASRDSSVFDFH